MTDDRGIPTTIIVPTEVGAERMPQDPILLVGPYNVPPGRTPDELSALTTRPVASAGDVCRAFGVKVEGAIRNEHGEEVQVSFPAEDEDSFTLGGFVRGDDTMHRLYVKSRLADWLASRGIQSLSETEVDELARRADFLEKSLDKEGE
jgi:hypothetical protein